MQARAFWKAVTLDRSDLLDRFLALLDDQRVRWCVVAGQAVNAYVDPVVSLDLLGNVWAVEDVQRRPSKRQKDLADIARILEAFPELRAGVPHAVLQRLV
jgi:hypothetical protein